MTTLFDYEKMLEIHDYHVAKDAEEKGMEKGMEKGVEKGRELTLLTNLKTLMEKLGCTAAQAMDMLNVPDEARSGLLVQL